MTTGIRERVLAEMERVVAEKGADYVYSTSTGQTSCWYAGQTSCWYADPDTGEPSCIVGHVIHGLDPELFDKIRQYEADLGLSMAVDRALSVGGSLTSEMGGDTELRYALHLAQRVQDLRAPWGMALEAFKDALDDGDLGVTTYWLKAAAEAAEAGGGHNEA